MSFKTCSFIVVTPVTLRGHVYAANDVHLISDEERIEFANDDDVLIAIGNHVITIRNGYREMGSVSNQINYLKDYSQA
jgi:hypothetical protein